MAAARRIQRRRRGLAARLVTLVCGRHPVLNLRVRFCLVASAIHAAWIFVYVYAVHAGIMTVGSARLMIASNLIGIFAFYPWVRGGHTLRLRDSGLVLPQMVWGSITAVMAFVLAPTLRPALLQVMCLIQVFGFFGLRPAHLVTTGGFALVALFGLLGFGMAGVIPAFDLVQETYSIAATIGVLTVLTAITVHQSRRRGALRRQKKALEAAVASVRELVVRDTLTGLFSRGYMLELLQNEHARAIATGRPFAVALIDVDHFKRINDTHGHGIGDEVLRRFADTVVGVLRSTDSVARWGGEEFLVLMPETDSQDHPELPLADLRARVRAQGAPENLLARLGVTFSSGIAVHDVHASIENTVARADRALYAAKEAGRDRCVLDELA